MSSPGAMTTQEREAFLADVHVGILAVDEPGDGGSLKARLLRAAGRATLTVQTETPPYQYVCVEGPVTIEATQRDDLEMASRYLGPAMGKWYADTNPSTAQSVTAVLRPEHWRTFDFNKVLG